MNTGNANLREFLIKIWRFWNILFKLLKLIFFCYLYIYIMSLISLLIIRKHIFLCILSLEFLIISLLLVVRCYSLYYTGGYYIILYIIVFFVCEGVLGLGVLVNIIRCYGRDYLRSINLW